MDPLPHHQVSFTEIRDVIVQFLMEHMNVDVQTIQPCHLGQACVRLSSSHDRDALVHNSPHQWLDTRFSFVCHDEGHNHRGLQFNHDCWFMLLGFPLDYWNSKNIEATIASFGGLLIWERDGCCMYRLLIKVNVVSLEAIPKFLVVTDRDDFHGESWTVQREILQNHMLGAMPQDEDQPPLEDGKPEDNQNPLFDFLGYGLPVAVAQNAEPDQDNDKPQDQQQD
jgi:hypothetical protein